MDGECFLRHRLRENWTGAQVAGSLHSYRIHNCDTTTQPNFFLRSSRNKVDLLSFENKTTDKREQYDWMGGKKIEREDMMYILQFNAHLTTGEVW